jgi:hypothetical protein
MMLVGSGGYWVELVLDRDAPGPLCHSNILSYESRTRGPEIE